MIRDFTYIDDIVSGVKGAILNPSKVTESDNVKLCPIVNPVITKSSRFKFVTKSNSPRIKSK